MFKLTSFNLSNLGAPMGKESVSVNYTEYFHHCENAKKYAEKDYKKRSSGETFKWSRKGKMRICSGDLRFVMYEIEQIFCKDKAE